MTSAKKSVFLFVLCACPIFPALSRLSFGLIFTLAFCISFLALLAARKLIFLCRIKEEYALVVELLFLLACSSLYSSLVRLALPLSAFALDFFLHAVPFIYLLFDSLFYKRKAAASGSLAVALTAAAFPPAFSLLRELLYFGTISFPAIGEVYSLAVLPSEAMEFTRFFGSLPGSLILTGLFLWLWNALSPKSSKPLESAS